MEIKKNGWMPNTETSYFSTNVNECPMIPVYLLKKIVYHNPDFSIFTANVVFHSSRNLSAIQEQCRVIPMNDTVHPKYFMDDSLFLSYMRKAPDDTHTVGQRLSSEKGHLPSTFRIHRYSKRRNSGNQLACRGMYNFASNIPVCVKMFNPQAIRQAEGMCDHFKTTLQTIETILHSRFSHPNILRFIQGFRLTASCYAIVHEFYVISIDRLIADFGSLPEWIIIRIMRDIVSALHYVHDLFPLLWGVMCVYDYIDLTTILLTEDGKAKLGYISRVIPYGPRRSKDTIGGKTKITFDPAPNGRDRNKDAPSNIHLLGLTARQLATGERGQLNPSGSLPMPFLKDGMYPKRIPSPSPMLQREAACQCSANVYASCTENDQVKKVFVKFSNEFNDFIACCCGTSTSPRHTASQLLEHPFLRQNKELHPNIRSYRDLFIQLHKDAIAALSGSRTTDRTLSLYFNVRAKVVGGVNKLKSWFTTSVKCLGLRTQCFMPESSTRELFTEESLLKDSSSITDPYFTSYPTENSSGFSAREANEPESHSFQHSFSVDHDSSESSYDTSSNDREFNRRRSNSV